MMATAKNDGVGDGANNSSDERKSLAPPRAHRPAMTYKIALENDHLRAELANCETVAEMRAFLRAVVRNATRTDAIFIRVRASKPVFHVERDGLIGSLQEIARLPRHRVALLGDSPDLHASLEYLELIARQRGVRVRTFRSETEALLWFRDRRYLEDRRQSGERRASERPQPGAERRSGGERRHAQRRSAART